MARQVYADNVDANGKVFETVGENIRKDARAGELLNFQEIIDKIDALDPEISALQADIRKNSDNIKKNTIDIANMWGLPVVNQHSKSGINSVTSSIYLLDNMHPNENGGKRIANVFINSLKTSANIIK